MLLLGLRLGLLRLLSALGLPLLVAGGAGLGIGGFVLLLGLLRGLGLHLHRLRDRCWRGLLDWLSVLLHVARMFLLR